MMPGGGGQSPAPLQFAQPMPPITPWQLCSWPMLCVHVVTWRHMQVTGQHEHTTGVEGGRYSHMQCRMAQSRLGATGFQARFPGCISSLLMTVRHSLPRALTPPAHFGQSALGLDTAPRCVAMHTQFHGFTVPIIVPWWPQGPATCSLASMLT